MTARSDALLWAVTFIAGAVLLSWTAIANGGPILYSDTVAYVLDSESLVRLMRPTNVRPVFYGLAIWPLHWERTMWPVLFVQGLVTAHVIYLALRAAGAGVGRVGLLLVLLALAVATPLSWYVSHAMPDIFSGVMVLALFLAGFCRDRLRRGELVYLVLLSAASITFHLTNLVISGAIAGTGILAWLFRRDWRRWISPVLLVGPIVMALAAYAAFSLALYGQVSVAPRSPPFLMARFIADGEGRDYLERECPTRHYQICPYLDRLPASMEGIIWIALPSIADKLDPQVFRAEAAEIASGTIRMFPLRVARNMVAAMGEQLFSIETHTDFPPMLWQKFDREGPLWIRGSTETLQSRGLLEDDALAGVNAVHAAVAAVSAVACFVLLWVCGRRRLERPLFLLGVVLVALPANAFVTGAFSGVFGRFQGRVIWLLPLAAIAAGLALRRVQAARALDRAGPGPSGTRARAV